jgi:hypothetical protein
MFRYFANRSAFTDAIGYGALIGGINFAKLVRASHSLLAFYRQNPH